VASAPASTPAELARFQETLGQLLAARQRYEELLEDANDVIYTHDLTGRFTSVNTAARRIFGYTRDEFLALRISDLVDPAHLPTATANMRRKVDGGLERTAPYELLTRAKDGHEVWVEVSTRRLVEGGQLVGIQGIARDVTDRHLRAEAEGRLHEQEREELERLAELERFKSDFLRMAAHELGTPLTPILIQAKRLEAMLEGRGDESHALAILTRNLARMNHLARHMLQAARLQSGRLVVEVAPMDLAQAIRDCAEAQDLNANEVRIEVDVPPTLPIRGDAVRLGQVVDNLVANAVKFSPAGGLVRVRARARDGGGVDAEVMDEGPGFSAAQSRLLFQPFQRIHEVSQPDRPGTGLGLYICKGILEQHGGRIWCEPRAAGAEFRFLLPRQEA